MMCIRIFPLQSVYCTVCTYPQQSMYTARYVPTHSNPAILLYPLAIIHCCGALNKSWRTTVADAYSLGTTVAIHVHNTKHSQGPFCTDLCGQHCSDAIFNIETSSTRCSDFATVYFMYICVSLFVYDCRTIGLSCCPVILVWSLRLRRMEGC